MMWLTTQFCQIFYVNSWLRLKMIEWCKIVFTECFHWPLIVDYCWCQHTLTHSLTHFCLVKNFVVFLSLSHWNTHTGFLGNRINFTNSFILVFCCRSTLVVATSLPPVCRFLYRFSAFFSSCIILLLLE